MHRQGMINFGLDKVDSKTYTNIVFKIITSVLAFNIFTLYSNSNANKKSPNISIASKRKERNIEKIPQVIIYFENFFTTLSFAKFALAIMDYSGENKAKFTKILNTLYDEYFFQAKKYFQYVHLIKDQLLRKFNQK